MNIFLCHLKINGNTDKQIKKLLLSILKSPAAVTPYKSTGRNSQIIRSTVVKDI